MTHMIEKTVNGKALRLVQGDITKLASDAIVNAANSGLRGGGGVDGAIHRAGGPAIMRELNEIRDRIGRCATGGAVPTTAGDLPAKYVFHAVGPVYRDGNHDEPRLLASAYETCMNLASERGVFSISFPSISTGVYGYPVVDAARIAIGSVRGCLEAETSVGTVTFVLFDDLTFDAYRSALAGIAGETG